MQRSAFEEDFASLHPFTSLHWLHRVDVLSKTRGIRNGLLTVVLFNRLDTRCIKPLNFVSQMALEKLNCWTNTHSNQIHASLFSIKNQKVVIKTGWNWKFSKLFSTVFNYQWTRTYSLPYRLIYAFIFRHIFHGECFVNVVVICATSPIHLAFKSNLNPSCQQFVSRRILKRVAGYIQYHYKLSYSRICMHNSCLVLCLRT